MGINKVYVGRIAVEDKQQDELARVFAMLSSLRKNIGQMTDYSILATYVREFHAALDKLENLEIDVSEFRAPDSEVSPRVVSKSYSKGASYSKEKYVKRAYFLTKLDAVLGYFELITSEKPRGIGFTK